MSSNPAAAKAVAGRSREDVIAGFLEGAGWSSAERRHLAGDASHRRYERLAHSDGRKAVLMDAPSDPTDRPLDASGRSYGDIAHLAADCRPFVAIATHLTGLGLSAPQLFAHDLDQGLILLEDLGDTLFANVIASGISEVSLYGGAVEALARLDVEPAPETLPLPGGAVHKVPVYDREAMAIETELLIDWYAPAFLGIDLPSDERDAFMAIWQGLFDVALDGPRTLNLRDFHSPNLIWLADRAAEARVGLLDFQDSVVGHPAYDLVSLLQDARRDVPAEVEAELLAHYLALRSDLAPEAFRAAYAVLGAQRSSKIIGIFARLMKRDNKPGYLVHLPRVWRYLERNLTHPILSDYRKWTDRNFPESVRR